jgi:hypothetical protein
MSKVDYRNFFPLLPPWQLTVPPPPRTVLRGWWRRRDQIEEAGFWTRQRKRQEHRALGKEMRRRAVR